MAVPAPLDSWPPATARALHCNQRGTVVRHGVCKRVACPAPPCHTPTPCIPITAALTVVGPHEVLHRRQRRRGRRGPRRTCGRRPPAGRDARGVVGRREARQGVWYKSKCWRPQGELDTGGTGPPLVRSLPVPTSWAAARRTAHPSSSSSCTHRRGHLPPTPADRSSASWSLHAKHGRGRGEHPKCTSNTHNLCVRPTRRGGGDSPSAHGGQHSGGGQEAADSPCFVTLCAARLPRCGGRGARTHAPGVAMAKCVYASCGAPGRGPACWCGPHRSLPLHELYVRGWIERPKESLLCGPPFVQHTKE